MINADPQNEMDAATAGPAHCPYCLLAEPPSVLPRQTSTTAKHCMGRRAEIALPKVRTEQGAPKIGKTQKWRSVLRSPSAPLCDFPDSVGMKRIPALRDDSMQPEHCVQCMCCMSQLFPLLTCRNLDKDALENLVKLQAVLTSSLGFLLD